MEVFLAFLKLGVTSFGGPIAHIGYFRIEFVERRKWLSERAYADLVALSQFLPGPASSQTGFGIGLMRGGYLGGLAAWVGFTAPSAILMVLFAYGAGSIADSPTGAALLHGLKLVAVAIVAQAVLGMARSLCPDRQRASIAALALILMLLVPGSLSQVGTIVLGGIAGIFVCRARAETAPDSLAIPVSHGVAIISLVVALYCLPSHSCRRAARWLCSTRSIAPELWYSVAVMLCCPCCAMPSWHRDGSATARSLRATARRRRCPVRCSPSPHISVPWQTCRRVALQVPSSHLWRSSCRDCCV